MRTFLKLIRWKNLLIVAATMFAMKYAVILPVYTYYQIPVTLSDSTFILLVLSVIFLISGGNVINDYFDRRTDMINRPEDVLVVFSVRRRQAIFIHLSFSLFGIICGFIVSYITGKTSLGFFFILGAALLWFYSTSFKKKAFIGDIITSFLTALIPFIVGIFEYYALKNINPPYNNDIISASIVCLYVICGFSIFAFLYSLILGIIKDCTNYDGDKQTGTKTIAVLIGKRNTNYIICGLSLISMFMVILAVHLFLPQLFFFENDNISKLYIYILIVIPTLIVTIISLIGTQKRKYIFLSTITKFIMLFGILFSLIFSFVIYGFI